MRVWRRFTRSTITKKECNEEVVIMVRNRKKIPDLPSPKKRFKWWIKNNYIYLIIVGVVCLAAALILISEVSQFERTRNMEALLNKSWHDIHWKQRGFSSQDMETLRKRYPNVNWEDSVDGQRRYKSENLKRERMGRLRAKKGIR